jgi:SPP1 gp7 family putative phage head morphogenesis protein
VIAGALERARGFEELNDAVLQKVEQEGAMKAIGTLFVLLSVAAVDISDSFYEPQLHAEMLGRLENPANDWSVNAAATPLFSQLPFKEAVEYFKSKAVVSPAAFSAMDSRARNSAFSMAGVHARYVLETAHEALFQAIAQGSSDRDALGRIRQAFADAGVESPSDFHLETVFDTSVLGAYAGGRYAQLTDPDVLAERPYWEYLTAGDGRVRPAHRAMAHQVFPADSPTWSSWFPPNGYRCRCSVRSLSHAEAYARGLVIQPAAPASLHPDPGFSGSPATQHVADGAIARLRGEAARSGVLGQAAGDLDRAGDRQRAERVDAFAKMTPPKIIESFVFPTKLAAAPSLPVESFDVEPPAAHVTASSSSSGRSTARISTRSSSWSRAFCRRPASASSPAGSSWRRASLTSPAGIRSHATSPRRSSTANSPPSSACRSTRAARWPDSRSSCCARRSD